MKLSEAIRVGMEKSGEIANFTLHWGAPEEPILADALGAAWLATHTPPWNEETQTRRIVNVFGDLRASYPVLELPIKWPADQNIWRCHGDHLADTIMDLMDLAGWTRGQIANWLETLGY